MSISNNIDGSVGGSNQLLDFLSLVTNPKVYESKIKALQEITAEHQKFVELVAPATEIMDLREKVKADKEKSKAVLEAANLKAESLVSQAQADAEKLVADAKESADKLNTEAQKAYADAKAAQDEARQDAAGVKKAKKDYDNLVADLKLQQDQLSKTQAKLDSLQKEAQAIKEDIIAKHTEFIKGL